MDESEFNDRVDDLFMEFEDVLDDSDLDLDIDTSGGLLTIGFPNGTTVVLSRQPVNREIWVAAKSGGFHLSARDATWFCNTSGEELSELMNRVFSEQLEQAFNLF